MFLLSNWTLLMYIYTSHEDFPMKLFLFWIPYVFNLCTCVFIFHCKQCLNYNWWLCVYYKVLIWHKMKYCSKRHLQNIKYITLYPIFFYSFNSFALLFFLFHNNCITENKLFTFIPHIYSHHLFVHTWNLYLGTNSEIWYFNIFFLGFCHIKIQIVFAVCLLHSVLLHKDKDYFSLQWRNPIDKEKFYCNDTLKGYPEQLVLLYLAGTSVCHDFKRL